MAHPIQTLSNEFVRIGREHPEVDLTEAKEALEELKAHVGTAGNVRGESADPTITEKPALGSYDGSGTAAQQEHARRHRGHTPGQGPANNPTMDVTKPSPNQPTDVVGTTSSPGAMHPATLTGNEPSANEE